MRLIAFAAVSSLALLAGACGPRIDYAHKTRLDCPERQGELHRTGVAADGRSCTYRAAEGAEVTLQLASVNGDAGAVLSGVEATLTGPTAPGQAPAEKDKSEKGVTVSSSAGVTTSSTTTTTTTTGSSGGDAAKVAQQAAADANSGKGAWSSDDDHDAANGHDRHGDVRAKDNAHVSLPGLHIDADDNNAQVDIAGVHIDANDDEATVHVIRDVRLRGQGFSRERNGLRATFLAKRDNLPDGYRFVGYQAAGPKTGPLTIAVVRSRDEIQNGNRLYHDIQRLVRLNAGA